MRFDKKSIHIDCLLEIENTVNQFAGNVILIWQLSLNK